MLAEDLGPGRQHDKSGRGGLGLHELDEGRDERGRRGIVRLGVDGSPQTVAGGGRDPTLP
ncbi:hypothetical protein [Streptomyces sp. SID12501]|uniref:Uncharacterized protein n=1 Tax=Streptomyces sp. SID12501 TaxID=2706042 RepID=A0A6B3C7B2_9ACTN|nr:hypothetical protein [Streptomyces sp. SID12501]NEC92314.1 hypothetical protein [Streptomyces sp. SID12501]